MAESDVIQLPPLYVPDVEPEITLAQGKFGWEPPPKSKAAAPESVPNPAPVAPPPQKFGWEPPPPKTPTGVIGGSGKDAGKPKPDIVNSLKAGLYEGPLDVIGDVIDAPNALWQLGKKAFGGEAYLPDEDTSDTLKTGLKPYTGYDPRDVPVATDPVARYTRSVAGAVTGTAPTFGAGALVGGASRLGAPALRTGGAILRGGGPVSAPLTAATGALGANVAMDLAPVWVPGPAAAIGGAVAGGALGAGAASTAGRIPSNIVHDFFDPMTMPWQRRYTDPVTGLPLTTPQRRMRDDAVRDLAGGENFKNVGTDIDHYLANPPVSGVNPALSPTAEISEPFGRLSAYADQKRAPGEKTIYADQPERELQRANAATQYPGHTDPTAPVQPAVEAGRPPPLTAAEVIGDQAKVEGKAGAHYQSAIADAAQKEADAAKIAGAKTKRLHYSNASDVMQDFRDNVLATDIHGNFIKDANGNYRIDNKKYASWMKTTGDSLPDPVKARFINYQTAQETWDSLTAARKDLEKRHPIHPGGSVAGITDAFFDEGTKGGAKFAAYRQIVKDDPTALGDMFDAVIHKLRTTPGNLNPDGTVNLAKANRWIGKHDNALSQFPKHLTDELSTNLQGLLDKQLSARAKVINDYERSAARFWLGGADLDKRINSLFTEGDQLANIRDIKSKLSHDPDALNGLKREVMDVFGKKYLSADGESIDMRALNRIATDNEKGIKELFGTDFHKILTDVSQDIINQQDHVRRMARMKAAGPIADPAALKRGLSTEMLHKASQVPTTHGTIISYLIALPQAVAGLIGAKALNGLVQMKRELGMTRINDTLVELSRNPTAAKLAMENISKTGSTPKWNKFRQAMTSLSTVPSHYPEPSPSTLLPRAQIGPIGSFSPRPVVPTGLYTNSPYGGGIPGSVY